MKIVIAGRVDIWNRAVESEALRVWLIEKIKFHFHFQCYGILGSLKTPINRNDLEMLDKIQ